MFIVEITPLTAKDFLPMILFTLGGFGLMIAECLCLDGRCNLKNLRKFLFRNKLKNWLFIVVAILIETLIFIINSDGMINKIPRSPIVVFVVMFVFLQSTVIYGGG